MTTEPKVNSYQQSIYDAADAGQDARVERVPAGAAFPVLSVGQTVRIDGARANLYKIEWAPPFSRTQTNGRQHALSFVYAFPLASVIDSHGGRSAEIAAARTISLGEIVVIDGHGPHRIIAASKFDRENVAVVRLADGFSSEQA